MSKVIFQQNLILIRIMQQIIKIINHKYQIYMQTEIQNLTKKISKKWNKIKSNKFLI